MNDEPGGCPTTRVTSNTGRSEDEVYEICLDADGHKGRHDWDEVG